MNCILLNAIVEMLILGAALPAAGCLPTGAFPNRINARGSFQTQVRCVPEEKDTADALRSVVPELKGKSFILISGDLVGDVSVKVRLHTLMHFEHCKSCPFQQFA